MPVEDFELQIEELTSRWSAAEIAVVALLATAAATPSAASSASLLKMAGEILAQLAVLINISAAWINVEVPRMYRAGIEQAAKAMGLPEFLQIADEALQLPAHRQDLEDLAQNLLDDLARATDQVGADAKKTIRDISRRRTQTALARGNPQASEAAPSFSAEMRERGVAFTDRRGRRWSPSLYARMVLRTHTAIIINAGTLNTAIERGSPGVAVSDGGPGDVDEPCEVANGQKWSLGYAIANPLEHPNCRRAFAPLPRSFEGSFDRI